MELHIFYFLGQKDGPNLQNSYPCGFARLKTEYIGKTITIFLGNVFKNQILTIHSHGEMNTFVLKYFTLMQWKKLFIL